MTEVIRDLAFPIVVFFFGLMIMERVFFAFVVPVRMIRRATGQPE
jgi:hypothetical protein